MVKDKVKRVQDFLFYVVLLILGSLAVLVSIDALVIDMQCTAYSGAVVLNNETQEIYLRDLIYTSDVKRLIRFNYSPYHIEEIDGGVRIFFYHFYSEDNNLPLTKNMK